MQNNEMCSTFTELSQKFSHIRVYASLNEVTKTHILEWLIELNKLDYRYPVIGNHTRGVLLIIQLCNLIPCHETALIAESTELIDKLIRKQRVMLEGTTLILLHEWCMNALTFIHSTDYSDDEIKKVLDLLEALVCSNLENLKLVLIPILHSMKRYFINVIQEHDCKPQLMLPVVQCLEALSSIPEKDSNDSMYIFPDMYNIFIRQLTYAAHGTSAQVIRAVDEAHYNQIWSVSLSGLRNIVERYEDILVPERVQTLLGVCKSYMVYKLNNIKFLLPAALHPSVLSIPEVTTVNDVPPQSHSGKTQKQRKQRSSSKCPKETPIRMTLGSNKYFTSISPFHSATEASDYSDADTESTKKFRGEVKVRHESLLLLRIILNQMEKPMVLSYFTAFMPNSTNAESTHNLSTCFLKDPSPRCRLAALNCLLSLLISGKSLLSHADQRAEAPLSFTPLSYTLYTIVDQLHRSLCLAINDTSSTVLTQVLKCLAALVQATPYHRLRPGLSVKIIRNIKMLISHHDTIVQVGSLIVLGCLLSSQPVVKDTTDALIKTQMITPRSESSLDNSHCVDSLSDEDHFVSFDDPEPSTSNSTENTLPWLLRRCLWNISAPSEEIPAPVKLESLQIISVMCLQHFHTLILPYLGDVTSGLLPAYNEKKYVDVLFHAGKTTESIGEAMNKHFELLASQDISLSFWHALLDSYLLILLQSEQPMLRAVGADCLAAIGEHTFELLPKGPQLLCMATLLSLANDEDNGVRGSAVRSIAIILLYSSVRADIGYILDAIDIIIRSMQDKSAIVRIKASWSLGNLSDTLVQNQFDPNVDNGETDVELLPLIRIAITGTRDNDKVKCNVVRALGNLLQLLQDDDANKEIMDEGVHALLRCAATGGIMKVRWNACYALGNILKIPMVYRQGSNITSLECASAHLSTVIFKTLAGLIESFRNLKVRINAAAAVMACGKREFYAQSYLPVWSALVKGIYSADNIHDLNEYNHRDNLAEQICMTLAHMLRLCTVNDLVSLEAVVSACDGDVHLLSKMERVQGRLLPEKNSSLLSAEEHLKNLLQSSLTAAQEQALTTLARIFVTTASYKECY